MVILHRAKLIGTYKNVNKLGNVEIVFREDNAGNNLWFVLENNNVTDVLMSEQEAIDSANLLLDIRNGKIK